MDQQDSVPEDRATMPRSIARILGAIGTVLLWVMLLREPLQRWRDSGDPLALAYAVVLVAGLIYWPLFALFPRTRVTGRTLWLLGIAFGVLLLAGETYLRLSQGQG